MPISEADLIALEERIKADIRRSQAQLEAVQVLKGKVREDNAGVTANLDLRADIPAPQNFSEAVRQAVLAFGNAEFTVASVENVLIERKVPLPQKNARARIAMILQDLTDRAETITRTFAGAGNVPNRYRGKVSLAEMVGKKKEGEAVSAASPSGTSPVGGLPKVAGTTGSSWRQ